MTLFVFLETVFVIIFVASIFLSFAPKKLDINLFAGAQVNVNWQQSMAEQGEEKCVERIRQTTKCGCKQTQENLQK